MIKQKDIVFLLGAIFFFVVLWTIFNVLHNTLRSTISPITSAQIAPISPTFDAKMIEKIKKREKVFSALETGGQIATSSLQIVSPTPQAIPTPTATSSSQPATQGAIPIP